jgi:hypothetical protein
MELADFFTSTINLIYAQPSIVEGWRIGWVVVYSRNSGRHQSLYCSHLHRQHFGAELPRSLVAARSLVGLNEFGFRRFCDRLVGLRKPVSLVIGKPMNDHLQEERSSTGISAFSSCKPWSRHEVTGRLVIRRGGRVGWFGSPEETLEADEAEVGLVFCDASSSKLPSFSCFGRLPDLVGRLGLEGRLVLPPPEIDVLPFDLDGR